MRDRSCVTDRQPYCINLFHWSVYFSDSIYYVNATFVCDRNNDNKRRPTIISDWSTANGFNRQDAAATGSFWLLGVLVFLFKVSTLFVYKQTNNKVATVIKCNK